MFRPLLLVSGILSVLVAPAAPAAPTIKLFLSAPVVRVQAPNTETRLRAVIKDLQSGSPNMNQFEPMLRVAIQQQKAKTTAYFAAMGQVTGTSFVGAQNGGDVYQVTFEHGVSAWWIQLAPNGNIAGLFFQ